MLLTGLRRGRPHLLKLGLAYSLVVLAGAVLATFAMQRALITRDYSVEFVFDHGSSSTPLLFNIATMWSALEGSILLWGLILAGYIATVAWRFRHRLEDPLVAWALVTMFFVGVFFFWIDNDILLYRNQLENEIRLG